MQATTIKLDARLHATIHKLKPREQSVTSYVRDLVAREEKRAALESASEDYATLLADHPKEAKGLVAWEATPLATVPKRRGK